MSIKIGRPTFTTIRPAGMPWPFMVVCAAVVAIATSPPWEAFAIPVGLVVCSALCGVVVHLVRQRVSASSDVSLFTGSDTFVEPSQSGVEPRAGGKQFELRQERQATDVAVAPVTRAPMSAVTTRRKA